MEYVITELGLIALFASFVSLTQYEERHGSRVLPNFRGKLDNLADKYLFIFAHVDFAEFVRDGIRLLGEKIAHDISQIALQGTRFFEQQLTRSVRYFRARAIARNKLIEPTKEQVEGSSEYLRTIVDFKQTLRNDREESES